MKTRTLLDIIEITIQENDRKQFLKHLESLGFSQCGAYDSLHKQLNDSTFITIEGTKTSFIECYWEKISSTLNYRMYTNDRIR